MFQRLSSEFLPSSSISTGWTGSIDHMGVGYIISELNGSPWENSSFGNFSDVDSFNDVWHGEKNID